MRCENSPDRSDGFGKDKNLKEQNQKPELTAARRKTSIGGQALMEGIMMRGPKKTALAVRNPRGEIVVEAEENKQKKRPAVCRLPVVRGVFNFVDSMVLGYRSLMRSAEISALDDMVETKEERAKRKGKTAPDTQTGTAAAPEAAEPMSSAASPETTGTEGTEEKEETEAKAEKNTGEEKLPAWVMTVMTVLSVGLALVLCVGLFMLLPSFLFSLLQEHVGFLQTGNAALRSFWKSLFEGLLKIFLLVGYMAAVSLMKDIRRTFRYHGAEHKTIFCYEAGLELTVENIRKQRRFHPRCGTSFLILMLLVSIFVSFFIDPLAILISGAELAWYFRALLKLLLIPLIMGIGYELIKAAGRHDNWATRIISAPGMWLQHITVFEPTDDMIECAIAAMKEVIPEDGSDEW